ncbi:MAG: ATP-binding protein [Rhodocyclaceae bacterium]
MRSTFLLHWLLLGAGLLLWAGGIAWETAQVRRAIEADSRRILDNHAAIAADALADKLEIADAALQTLLDDPAARTDARLRARVAIARNVRALLVLDAAGNTQASSRDELLGRNFAQRDYFRDARAAKDAAVRIVSPPFDSALGMRSFALARKLVGPTGEFAGVVVAIFDPDYLSRMLGPLLIFADMRIQLTDAAERPILALPYVQQAATEPDRMAVVHIVRSAYLQMSQPLAVGVSRDTAAMLADWRRGVWVKAGLLLCGALVSAGGLALYQRRRRELLRALEQLRKLSLAVEQSPESILITDTRGDIEFVNAAFCRSSGYAPEEVLGKNPRLLKSGLTPPEIFVALWAELAAGRPWQGELINRRKNGEIYVEYEIIAPIRQPDGTVTHYLDIKEDITERKRMGEELDRHRLHLEELVVERTARLDETNLSLARALDHAEAATRAKAAFLANMSHEIRTPLNGVLGMAHVMRRDASPRQLDQIDKIAAAGRHLLAIINDILDLSKIDAGKLTLEETDFAPAAIPANVASMVAEMTAAKGLALRVETGSLPERLRGDPTRLTQALLNYVSNAVKFTERGTVTIRARLTAETATEATLRFEVRDTGMGIAPEVLARLFGDFEQGDNGMTRRHGGTGLGLAITRRLAIMMGGEAGVDSAPGQGSTFWFTCRLAKSVKVGAGGTAAETDGERVAEDALAALKHEFPGARILVAEDEPINREVVGMLIEDAGLTVEMVGDGAQAAARAGACALVLMDMMMPTLDGIEATRRIRAQTGTEALPILALTANAFAEDRERCLAAGMDDFLSKPVDPGNLYAKLLYWLRQRRGITPPARNPP